MCTQEKYLMDMRNQKHMSGKNKNSRKIKSRSKNSNKLSGAIQRE